MKKKILFTLITLVLLFSIVLTGCSASGVAQEKYDQVVAQLADSQSKLTKAQSDLTVLMSAKITEDSDLETAQAKVTDLQQQVAGLKVMYEFVGLTTTQKLERINQIYAANHFYEQGVYDCYDMSGDVWNILKAYEIDSVIVIGNVDQSITDILQSDHAWVLTEVAPGEYLALDGTNGRAYTKASGPLYFHGWTFLTPADLRANDDLILEYNIRVVFRNSLIAEKKIVNDEYTQAINQGNYTLADQKEAIFNKLTELIQDQETLATSLMNQINQLATPLSL